MKLRFILDRLDELPLFLFSIYMCLWALVPYSTEELKQVVERQSLTTTHCYATSDEDKITLEDPVFRKVQNIHEIYARVACVEVTFPLGSIHVGRMTKTDMTLVLDDPVVDVMYGRAIPFTTEGMLPLNRRVALSTKLRTRLRGQCDMEAKRAGPEAVRRRIHALARGTNITISISSTNWCETGPVA